MYTLEGMESIRLLMEGATPKQIDNILTKEFGMIMGIFQVMDLSGLDIGDRSRVDHGITKNPPKNRRTDEMIN